MTGEGSVEHGFMNKSQVAVGKLIRKPQKLSRIARWPHLVLPLRNREMSSTGVKDQSISPEAPDRGTHRVEAFSDGFFAIVITLLVLDLRLPEAGQSAPETLAQTLRGLWPVALAYMISFINIYILWVSHHELMRITTRADISVLYLNGALLLGIGVMPFSTAVLADHINGEDPELAAAIYCGALLWVAIGFNLIWRYLARRPDRLLRSVSSRDRHRISRTYFAALVLYALAFALAWIAPLASVAITLALAIFFAVADRLSGFASEDIAV